jgi:hypothetical protein
MFIVSLGFSWSLLNNVGSFVVAIGAIVYFLSFPDSYSQRKCMRKGTMEEGLYNW